MSDVWRSLTFTYKGLQKYGRVGSDSANIESIKNSCEGLNKLKSRDFCTSSLSTYDFSTLYTTLPHNLIKDKLVDLTERIFQREGSLTIGMLS